MNRRRVIASLTAVVAVAALATGAAGGALADGTRADGTRADGAAAPTAARPSTTQAPQVSASGRYIVRLADPEADPAVGARVAAVIRAHGGSVVSLQEALATVVVRVPHPAAVEIAALAGVGAVTPDAVARVQSLGFSPSTQPGSMTTVTRLTGAQAAWKRGWTGAGVDVAVIDTGVAPVQALAEPTKVVPGPDLSFESQATNLRYLDTFGHGTHMASIIAGRGAARASGAAYAADTTNFYGMAPDARIISLKVGDRNGAVDVSQLIAAIDWVVQNRTANGLNIRVLNLSFGTDGRQSYVIDPLSFAAQVAWDAGITVVASVGNDGDRAAGLANPAYNPYLIAVGALDTKGTDARGDDSVPTFSQHPRSTLLEREPDLVAPGVGIVAAGVPGSYLYETYGGARVGNGYFRGSGTSQAAAVVSGAAALLYQRWPSMNPADVKDLLTRSAVPLGGVAAGVQGRGALNLTAAMNSAPRSSGGLLGGLLSTVRNVVNVGLLPATGAGSLEGARGTHHVGMDGVVLVGERDIMGKNWANALISLLTRQWAAWSGDGWFNDSLWIGAGFTADTTTWAGRTWGGRTWAGRTWAGSTWTGRTWAGRTWAGSTWNGSTWTAADWSGSVDGTFAGRTWSAAEWR